MATAPPAIKVPALQERPKGFFERIAQGLVDRYNPPKPEDYPPRMEPEDFNLYMLDTIQGPGSLGLAGMDGLIKGNLGTFRAMRDAPPGQKRPAVMDALNFAQPDSTSMFENLKKTLPESAANVLSDVAFDPMAFSSGAPMAATTRDTIYRNLWNERAPRTLKMLQDIGTPDVRKAFIKARKTALKDIRKNPQNLFHQVEEQVFTEPGSKGLGYWQSPEDPAYLKGVRAHLPKRIAGKGRKSKIIEKAPFQQRSIIGVKKDLSQNMERTVLSHELGHETHYGLASYLTKPERLKVKSIFTQLEEDLYLVRKFPESQRGTYAEQLFADKSYAFTDEYELFATAMEARLQDLPYWKSFPPALRKIVDDTIKRMDIPAGGFAKMNAAAEGKISRGMTPWEDIPGKESFSLYDLPQKGDFPQRVGSTKATKLTPKPYQKTIRE